MKQHITKEQLDELKDKTAIYRAFVKDKEHGYLLSIGQMIEFLDEHENIKGMYFGSGSIGWEWENEESNLDMFRTNKFPNELCDALWEAVKEVLEKK